MESVRSSPDTLETRCFGSRHLTCGVLQGRLGVSLVSLESDGCSGKGLLREIHGLDARIQ